MSQKRHLNMTYDGAVPIVHDDRYCGQDRVVDFLYQCDIVGRIYRDIFGAAPVILSGGVVSQGVMVGGQYSLDITAMEGVIDQITDIMNLFAANPPSKTTATITRRVSLPAQTAFDISGTATFDGATPNYIKVKYAEAAYEARTRAKGSGSYDYAVTESFQLIVNATPPAGSTEILLATFIANSGGALAFDFFSGTGRKDMIPAAPGDIKMTGAMAAPTGWHLCDGASLVRSGNVGLFNAIGTMYGAADSDHFNLPDFRGVFPKGLGTTDRVAGVDALGNFFSGGATPMYSTDQVQNHAHTDSGHSHGLTDPGHVHSIFVDGYTSLYYSNAQAGSNYGGITLTYTPNDIYAQSHVTGISMATAYVIIGGPTTNSAGTPRVGNTTEPQSLSVNFIIKM